MKKTYIVKHLVGETYWSCLNTWDKDAYMAHEFETLEEAEDFILQESGKFIIETVYSI